EILETSTALWVSPGNQRIAYLRFNDSRTGRYEMQWFGSPEAAYPQRRSVYYPKAGSVGAPISNVTVHVFDVKTTRTAQLARPGPVPEEHYIGAVRWLDADRLLLAWLDRSQTEGCLTVCRLPEATCSLIYNEHRPTGWVELMKQTNSQPLVDPTGNRIFIVLHNSGFRRLAHLRTDSFKVLQWITPAAYDVSDIVHFDRHAGTCTSCHAENRLTHAMLPKCTFTGLLSVAAAASRRSPVPQVSGATTFHSRSFNHSRIPVPSSDQQSPVANCMTCEPLLHPFNVTCDYSLASFSHSGEHFLHECLGPEPFQYFLRHNDYSSNAGTKRLVEAASVNQANSSAGIQAAAAAQTDNRQGACADPLEVNAKLLVPAQLNESHITKYPLLLKVYGGPTAQMVTRRFELGWQHYMGSALHFITASVDGRGTGNRGSDFLFAIKSSFAGVELQDQMDALKALRSLQYVNSSAVALFGWSYGGFLALHMLGHPFNANNSYCSCAVAVASVTDFSYYNSGYTERYLGIKSDKSAEAYRRTNVTQLAANFWNKDLFLVHGTADDNVHYQNTAQLVKALVLENIDFEFMVRG
uniref:Peptidase_S9 domain-containing protein n=1 Tax=Macrostomum lignano TaxID=282301 RepID=A0A1I8JML9_9PLAT